MLYKQIQEEINSLRGMRNLVETYEEIAAMRTRRVKKSVLQNRDFLSGLNDIFQQVEHSYETQIKTLKNKTPSTANNGKTVSVFISANTGLYGDIIKRTFNLYLKDIQNKETDMVIVGRLGKVMLEEVKPGSDYKYFEISDSESDE
jgi:F0F1-type ATP synthase gamma subunit